MENTKHYPTHPGAEHPPTMCMEIPIEEYESIKRENAELKAKVDELSFDKKLLENHWESEKIRCEAASRDCIELSNENAKLVSKIESLKVGHRQGIANLKSYYKAKLESVQASMYCDVVDANMENRRLKRALWMARAERAKAIKWHEGLERYLQERKKYLPSRFSFMKDDEMYHLWYKCWCKVERKCLAKAEEYK